MPFPPLLLLLLAGGAAAVAAASAKRKDNDKPNGMIAVHRPPPLAKPTMVLAPRPAEGPIPVKAVPPPPSTILDTFGKPGAQEFPAPYRYADARKIADIALAAASETSPKSWPHYLAIKRNSDAIESGKTYMPNAYKAFALIMTVVMPSFAAGLWWHWYRPRTPYRKKQYQAIAAWATMFCLLPETAWVAVTLSNGGRGPALLSGMDAYLNATGKVRMADTPAEHRYLLYDVFGYLFGWPQRNIENWFEGTYTGLKKMERLSIARIEDADKIFPVTGPAAKVIEGNFAVADDIMWWMMYRVEAQIKVDFDETAAWVALFVRIVATVASAAAAFVSPAASALIQAAASTIGGIATALADGEISSYEMQAITGSAVAYALQTAGIDLGLENELAQIEKLME